MRPTVRQVNAAKEIRVRKVRSRKLKYSLAKLVAGITKRNRHEEISTGPPVRGEAWWTGDRK